MSRSAIDELTDQVMALRREVAALRRLRNQTLLPGTVEKVEGSRVYVRLSDDSETGGPIVTPPLRMAERTGKRGGGVSRFSRYGVGEPVLVVSPNGEVGAMSAVKPWIDTEDDPSPGKAEQDGEVLEHGNAKLEVVNGMIRATVDGASLTLTANLLKALVARMENNGRNIGHDHKHRDVEPGGGTSGIPNP